MCNNCTHAPVCGKCKATGGQVGKCEHFKEERRGRWEEWYPGIALIMTGEEKTISLHRLRCKVLCHGREALLPLVRSEDGYLITSQKRKPPVVLVTR